MMQFASHQNHKPGLAEVLALLQQFGPGQQLDQEKLSQMQAAAGYAQKAGYPNLEAMQLGQQQQRNDSLEADRQAQESRLDQAQEGQTKLHETANLLDFARLLQNPYDNQGKPPMDVVEALRQRVGLQPQKSQPAVDPRLGKHIIPR